MALYTVDVSSLLDNSINVEISYTANVSNALIPNVLGIIEGVDDTVSGVYYRFTKFDSSSKYLPTTISRTSTVKGEVLPGAFTVGNSKQTETIVWNSHSGRTDVVLSVPSGYSDPPSEPTLPETVSINMTVDDRVNLYINNQLVVPNGLQYDDIELILPYTVKLLTVEGYEFIPPIVDGSINYTGSNVEQIASYDITTINPTIDIMKTPKLTNINLVVSPNTLPDQKLFFDVYVQGVLTTMAKDRNGIFAIVTPVTVDYEEDIVIEFRVHQDSQYTFKDPFSLEWFRDWDLGEYIVSDVSVKNTNASSTINLASLSNSVPSDIRITVKDFSYQLKPQPKVEQFPFINIYNVELDQLELLNTYRFTELVYTTDNIVMKDSDISNYIVNLIKFPFSVAGGDPTNILIGDTLTTFTGSFIDNNLYEVDLGTIFVPMTIQGSVAFSNVTIECYVPYMQKFMLDPDEVLGKVLQFKMIVNLLTGLVTINVFNTFTQSNIYSDSVLVGESIPNAIGGGVDTSTDTILNTTTDRVYIEVKTLRPNNSTVTDQLLNVTGFIQVDNMLINSVATVEEQDEIRKLLRQGVFINE